MAEKINDFPNLNVRATISTATNKFTITNLFAGAAGNVGPSTSIGSTRLQNLDGMSGGLLREASTTKISEKFGPLVTFTEPAVASSYYPLVYNLGHYVGEDKLFIQRFGLAFDYANNISYFSNDELNKLLLLDDLDDEVYEEIKELYLDDAFRI